MGRLKQTVKSRVLAHGRIWMGPARGLRMSGPDSLRIYLGYYETELNPWLKRMVRPGFRAFDIGAQHGLDALAIARLGAVSTLAVESDPSLEKVIHRNVLRNDLDSRVDVEIGFVGNGSEGTVSIDHLASRHFAPDFVKMDIEGGEFGALQGAEATL